MRSRINTHTVLQSLLTNTVYNLLRRIIRGGDRGGLMEREGLLNIVLLRDLSENSRGKGGGNFKFGFGNEVTHPGNESEIC